MSGKTARRKKSTYTQANTREICSESRRSDLAKCQVVKEKRSHNVAHTRARADAVRLMESEENRTRGHAGNQAQAILTFQK